MSKNDRVYFLSEVHKLTHGTYVPHIAVKGKDKAYLTDWDWGDNEELAQECLNVKNSGLLGIPPIILEDGTKDYSEVDKEATLLYLQISMTARGEI